MAGDRIGDVNTASERNSAQKTSQHAARETHEFNLPPVSETLQSENDGEVYRTVEKSQYDGGK